MCVPFPFPSPPPATGLTRRQPLEAHLQEQLRALDAEEEAVLAREAERVRAEFGRRRQALLAQAQAARRH
jgi:hypothetical protein